MSQFQLPNLPYAEDALEPHISAKTFSFHYGKHHNAYCTKLNNLVENTKYYGESLEEIIQSTSKTPQAMGIFNNAAQFWNHTFFWNSMSPTGGGEPTGNIANAIQKTFGSFDVFKTKFAEAATTLFGSGWVWLIKSGDNLFIEKTSNADTPIAHGKTPLLTLDVWEHAYYLDFQNKRPDYINIFLTHLVNWGFAEKNLNR